MRARDTRRWRHHASTVIALNDRGLYARMASSMIGLGIYVASFLSRLEPSARFNAAACGLAIFVCELASPWRDWTRWGAAVASAWLIISSFVVAPQSTWILCLALGTLVLALMRRHGVFLNRPP